MQIGPILSEKWPETCTKNCLRRGKENRLSGVRKPDSFRQFIWFFNLKNPVSSLQHIIKLQTKILQEAPLVEIFFHVFRWSWPVGHVGFDCIGNSSAWSARPIKINKIFHFRLHDTKYSHWQWFIVTWN